MLPECFVNSWQIFTKSLDQGFLSILKLRERRMLRCASSASEHPSSLRVS